MDDNEKDDVIYDDTYANKNIIVENVSDKLKSKKKKSNKSKNRQKTEIPMERINTLLA